MEIEKNLVEECVCDLNLREPITVRGDTVVRAVVKEMRERQLGCAVVVDSSNKPTGVFTERSLLEVLTRDESLDNSKVDDFAWRPCEVVRLTDPISVVYDAVQRRGMRFVCVIDQEGCIVGLTGQRGLSEYFAEHFPHQVMVQRIGGKPTTEQREGA